MIPLSCRRHRAHCLIRGVDRRLISHPPVACRMRLVSPCFSVTSSLLPKEIEGIVMNDSPQPCWCVGRSSSPPLYPHSRSTNFSVVGTNNPKGQESRIEWRALNYTVRPILATANGTRDFTTPVLSGARTTTRERRYEPRVEPCLTTDRWGDHNGRWPVGVPPARLLPRGTRQRSPVSGTKIGDDRTLTRGDNRCPLMARR